MYALFIVVNNGKNVKEILKEMKKVGITGATIIDSMGSGRYEELGFPDFPLIGGLAGLADRMNLKMVYNKTIFCVMESMEKVEQVADRVEEILGGDMSIPGTGIMFSFPLNMVRGELTVFKKKNKED
jgi:nitrogen regulatory protein PII